MTIATDRSVSARASTASVDDYFALLKPRVMSLVLFTAIVGLITAQGSLNPFLSIAALLSIAVGAGASGALNMWFDADIDAKMARTVNRPIPAKRVQRSEAAAFGLLLSVLSVLIMALSGGYLAAGLLAFTIVFYAVVYTMWLKRSTAQNIVIGGVAGALPPVIGWAAATGELSLAPWTLFLVIFLWTPPHFWALALVRSREYENAGVPMMPAVAGVRSTKRQIFLYALVLVAASFAPLAAGVGAYLYLTAAVLAGAGFIWKAGLLLVAPQNALEKPAMQLFVFSIFYLFALFAALLIDSLLGAAPLFG